MHEKLPQPRNKILDILARRALDVERSEADESGRKVLYDLARDKVVAEYTNENQERYQTNWLQLMAVLNDAPTSSMWVADHATRHQYPQFDEARLREYLCFYFEQTILHEGAELRIATALTTFTHELNTYRHLRFKDDERIGFGPLLYLKQLQELHRDGKSHLGEQTKPHERYGAPSEKLGFRRHAVPLLPELLRAKRDVLQQVGYIHASVSVQPMHKQGNDEREVILETIVSDSDFDSALYPGYLPAYDEGYKREQQHPFIQKLPRVDSKIVGFALKHLPDYLPDRTVSHGKIEEVLGMLAGSQPATHWYATYIGAPELTAMKAEFNGATHNLQDNSWRETCRVCYVKPAPIH